MSGRRDGALHIGVHRDDSTAASRFDTREESGLFAEVSRKRNPAHMERKVVARGKLLHDGQRTVAQPIIDQDKLYRIQLIIICNQLTKTRERAPQNRGRLSSSL